MRYFTPESATRTLPLVRHIVDDLLALQIELVFRGDRVNALEGREGLATSRAHADELADMRLSLQKDRARIDSVLEELGKLGVVLNASGDGAVDFPAMMNNREVRLCWKPGDESVLFWHEIDEPVSQRKPIDNFASMAFGVWQESQA